MIHCRKETNISNSIPLSSSLPFQVMFLERVVHIHSPLCFLPFSVISAPIPLQIVSYHQSS